MPTAPIERFTQIVVIESIPAEDAHNGRKIHEDLLTLTSAYSRPLSIKYVDALDLQQLGVALDAVLVDAKFNGHRPIVHFECHGSDDQEGMILVDGSFVSWQDLKPILTKINMGCGCGLLIVLSMCHGGNLIDIVDLTDRAPCWGMIGPMRSTSAGALLQGFAAFYRVLLSTRNGDLAIKELFKANPSTPYAFIPAEGFFRRVYAGYLQNHTHPSELSSRAKRLSRMLSDDGRRVGRGAMKRILKKNETVAFDKFKKHFFMTDLFPINDKRFVTTYADVKALSQTPAK